MIKAIIDLTMYIIGIKFWIKYIGKSTDYEKLISDKEMKRRKQTDNK